MKLILVNAHNTDSHAHPGVHKIHIEHHSPHHQRSTITDLLLLDTRSMAGEVLENALELVTSYQSQERARFAVAVCPNPTLDVVVRVMRAGFSDLYQNPLSTKQLLRCLKPALPRGTEARRRLSAFLSYSRLFSAPGIGNSLSTLQDREDFNLRMREERLQNESRRLEEFRDSLAHREEQLRASTRRLESDFARLQQDQDLATQGTGSQAISEGTAAHFKLLRELERELQEKGRALALRERSLEVRERMLIEFEAMLGKQAITN